MLLILVLLSAALAHSEATPAVDSRQTEVSHYNVINMPNSYNFHYEASDGSSRTERGEILQPGTSQAALDVLGTVRWFDKKGQLYEMSYKAGRRGYRTVIKKIS